MTQPEIIYEDEAILVCHKPAGVATQTKRLGQKDMESILKNYIYNLSYQILTLILPIITTPYLARVLGAEGTGIYGYTFSIATY